MSQVASMYFAWYNQFTLHYSPSWTKLVRDCRVWASCTAFIRVFHSWHSHSIVHLKHSPLFPMSSFTFSFCQTPIHLETKCIICTWSRFRSTPSKVGKFRQMWLAVSYLHHSSPSYGHGLTYFSITSFCSMLLVSILGYNRMHNVHYNLWSVMYIT
jgi:hypothetical protein